MSAADVVALFDHHPPDVVENAIPWLALQSGVDIATAPAPLQSVMLRFADRAGLRPDMTKDDVTAAITGWFAAHPLPTPLLQELAAVARRLTAEAGAGGDRDAAARLLGTSAARLPVAGQPVPDGAMKNSPLARFRLEPKKSGPNR